MLEFIIVMVILDLLMKWQVGTKETVEEPKPKAHKDCNKAYVCGNSMEWEFESLDDAMDFREWRLAGNKGNAIDYYRYRNEE